MRIILYTGKGGVGKTSVAAASALRAAELGYKTIVLSTDSAHSLSDSFDISLSSEPRLIAPKLWGQETNMSQTLRTYWDTIQEWMAALLMWRGVDEVVADELAILPGMEELANLLYIIHYHDEGNYDVVVVDCAPTGETLRLLSFPEILRWWMEKIFPTGRLATRVVRPLVKFASDIPMPSDDVFDSAENLFGELNRIQELLTDPKETSARLVVNPEKMVIKEAQRTFTCLNLYGYCTDLVICNRLISEEVKDPYFDYWKRNQAEHYSTIEQYFSPLPILSLPLFEQEIVGISMLQDAGRVLYKDKDPTKFFFHGQAQNIEGKDGSYILNLTLPFTAKGDIELMRNDEELAIQVGSFRRNIILPAILKGLSVAGAKFEGDRLKVSFVREESGKSD
jgi:arsenite-transporting ATPase